MGDGVGGDGDGGSGGEVGGGSAPGGMGGGGNDGGSNGGSGGTLGGGGGLRGGGGGGGGGNVANLVNTGRKTPNARMHASTMPITVVAKSVIHPGRFRSRARSRSSPFCMASRGVLLC